jgi:hypothetical protein
MMEFPNYGKIAKNINGAIKQPGKLIPSILGEKTPTEWKEYLEQLGFDVKPLGKGSPHV